MMKKRIRIKKPNLLKLITHINLPLKTPPLTNISHVTGINKKTHVISSIYDKNINKYKVKCGSSLEDWEKKNWIHKQDPYGWFQWYCRFYKGRRTDDDERQINRWKNLAGPNGRFRKRLINMIKKKNTKYNDETISPVIRQVLLHWAYELNASDL